MMLFLASLALLSWIYLFFAHGRFWHADCLPESHSDNSPEVYAIIPARNETEVLNATLPTLLTHDYPNLKIVLVDDQSEDATAALAKHIAEQHSATKRFTIISGQSRMGWKGKVSAMQSGLDYIKKSGDAPRYVLFTDADIAYSNDALKKLVAEAETNNNVLTSLMVHLRCESFAEKFLIPAFVYFFKMLYPFDWVNDASRETAAAAGGCMLVRYDALLKAGELAPIQNALIDDCALGKLMKQQGPLWLDLTKDVLSLRAYPLVNDIRSMVARTAYDQLNYSPLQLTGAILGMMLLYVIPVLLAVFGSGSVELLSLITWGLMSFTFLPLLRFYNRPAFMSLTLPFVALCYMGFTLDSAFNYAQGKGGLWKGRAQATI